MEITDKEPITKRLSRDSLFHLVFSFFEGRADRWAVVADAGRDGEPAVAPIFFFFLLSRGF